MENEKIYYKLMIINHYKGDKLNGEEIIWTGNKLADFDDNDEKFKRIYNKLIEITGKFECLNNIKYIMSFDEFLYFKNNVESHRRYVAGDYPSVLDCSSILIKCYLDILTILLLILLNMVIL